jgi:hypothetical protein
MTRVVADQELRSKLHGLDSHVEVHDESGRPLGHYLPEADYHELLYAWARSLFTDEQIQKARAEPGGLTTAEVLARLRGLEQSGANGT